MSIKKLFESNKNYLSDTTDKETFEEVESSRNASAIAQKQHDFIPQIDYSDPKNFAKYGSAYLYYKSAIERVIDFYPYDGSGAEINEFYNKSLDIEKYIFNNLYPRTNGYIQLSSGEWGTLSGTLQSGYGLPSTLEYIDFKGGPNTTYTGTQKTSDLFLDPDTSQYQSSNIYDDDIYTTAGLPNDYGSGTRESNLKSDFDTGVSVEFWVKTGSLDTSLTNKQVLVDIWNNELSSSAYGGGSGANPNPSYGRITIAFNALSSGSPFVVTAQSGATGIFEQSIGTDLQVGTLEEWKHYAITLQNTGSDFVSKLYVDGRINDINYVTGLNINEINSKNMVGRLGALITAPSGAAGDSQETENMVGAGKLSGSVDEFRFWKVARTGKDIGKYWFTQVRGGTNNDVSNTTLGLYYKFNEGITGDSSIDSNVLDYSGRITNGTWTGYSSTARFTGSAIVETTSSIKEYKDPIIYATHPDVINLKDGLLSSGSYHDTNNISSLKSLIPSWIVEEEDESKEINNINMVSHIMGTYFDKLYLLISALPTFKNDIYTSSSYTPLPFAQHLPQSLGLYTPEVFVDADIIQKFLNRTDDQVFQGDLTETKNLIYLNLYNNLTDIYKAKGTEKAIRNVFRCFNIDDRLLRLNTYSDNNLFTLKNNLKQVIADKTSLNFNENTNLNAVVYQGPDAANGESRGYISGSGPLGYEDKYGFTLESDIVFPRFFRQQDKFDRDYNQVSLFGIYSASIDDPSDTTFYATDDANFQIMAVKDGGKQTKNVYFKLTSSITPFPLPELTSSVFLNVYDNDRWNISVRLKPSNFPVTEIVSGSDTYTYDLVFRGVNTILGEVNDSFTLTASVTQDVGRNLLRASKRVFAGARNTNITGSALDSSDVIFGGVRYWGKYIDDESLDQHIFDIDNSGVSGSYMDVSPLDSNISNHNVLNSKMLFLDWNFDQVTSSNVDGTFVVTDFSSGSALIRDNFSWVGDIAGYQHTGLGYGFSGSTSNVVVQEKVNSYKFIDPELVISSEMIQVLSDDDKVFDITETVPQYIYTLEKSMHNAISEEMLQFFAGVVDFNNVIGEAVNRYRDRYKSLEKLREIFFRRVTEVKHVEKFLTYYQWFEDALAQIISQLLPASSDFVADTYNTVESHVLERNKYQTKFPTLEFNIPDPEAPIGGIAELKYPWLFGHSPLPMSPRPTYLSGTYWLERAERNASDITSGDPTIDGQRNNIRDVRFKVPTLSQSKPTLTTVDGTKYTGRQFALERFAKTYDLDVSKVTDNLTRVIKGGVNFEPNKSIQYTYTALRPDGPINTDNEVFVPQNVLVGFTDDMVGVSEVEDVVDPNKKIKRYIKVQHGRDWEEGLGYKNINSSFAFPFNIMSSSVKSGYNKQVIDRVTASISITNLHNDVYGPFMERPMQGPFTDYAVGGHQSRHIALNASKSANTVYVNGLDNYLSRPEAWKILLGKCPNTSGALGMAGPDYPWPEANEEGERPYPMTGSQRAVYYRDFIAKRPVNTRNILLRTGSTILGNYSQNYEVVSTVGMYANPRNFVEQQPTLPAVITTEDNIKYTTQVNNLINIWRGSGSHIDLNLDYEPVQFTSSNNNSVIIGRFAAPGGPEIMSRGFTDIKSSEFSAYNALPFRNLRVKKPWQGPSGSLSDVTGSGIPGIRVYDIHGKDYGLVSQLARHTARFGRDSLFVTSSDNLPGASYTQLPGFHKVHRNTKIEPRLPMTAGAAQLLTPQSAIVLTSSVYDNFYVQHPIPRMTRQYSWITNSIMQYGKYDLLRYFGIPPLNGPQAGMFSSSTDGYVAYFDFVSSSQVNALAFPQAVQPTYDLNIFIYEPVSASTSNLMGYPTQSFANDAGIYFNKDLINSLPTAISSAINRFPHLLGPATQANYLNLLLTKRGGTFGWNWKAMRQDNNPLLRQDRMSGTISVYGITRGDRIVTSSFERGTLNPKSYNDNFLSRYRLTPVSMRGRPSLINFDSVDSSENLTLKATSNNEKVFFNEVALDNYYYPNLSVTTPFDQVVDVVVNGGGYSAQWVTYAESVFPSLYTEFRSSSRGRVGYDNLYWRDSQEARITLGSDTVGVNSFNRDVNQSSWVLDPQQNFLTRLNATTWLNPTPANAVYNRGKAGELQNNYVHALTSAAGVTPDTQQRIEAMAPGALYSRKQMLESFNSVVSRNGVKIAETGSAAAEQPAAIFSSSFYVNLYAGEAVWEAGSQAGYITGSSLLPFANKFSVFTAAPSEPWFNSYDDYGHDLKLVAKDFSVVPEFRISEHVEEYQKYGVLNIGSFNTFEIPGTNFSSSQDTFYTDYSNSEFMKDFLKVSEDTLLNATEIKLVCSAAVRFNPYKGFYPAQRTLDIVSQFSRSYAEGFSVKTGSVLGEQIADAEKAIYTKGASLRPLLQPLFAPGILFNSIKSGMAVDYPIITDYTKLSKSFYGPEGAHQSAIGVTNLTDDVNATTGYHSGSFWDKRLSFETIIDPSTTIKGIQFGDVEPHPSASFPVSASWTGDADGVYKKMTNNFFAESLNVFLKNGAPTSLKSNPFANAQTFTSGSVYGARLKMRRSMTGPRTYQNESGSDGANTAFGVIGARYYNTSSTTFITGAEYPIPQDPGQNLDYKETFTLYSRTTAFGPACSGRPPFADGSNTDVLKKRPLDSFDGYNWSFTPPYYHGEAWADFIFRPNAAKTYNLQDILNEIEVVYWRADPGYAGIGPDNDTAMITSFPKADYNIDGKQFAAIYSGHSINHNAMQVSASLNLFGIETVDEEEIDQFGQKIKDVNKSVGQRWVIQPKWETPMLNFNDDGVHKITDAAGNLSVPFYGSASVPRGMWHQFGIIPDSPSEGVFMEIGEIPNDWLKYHYDVVTNNSVYNNSNAQDNGKNIYLNMESLVDLIGFENTSARLGELPEKITIKEAIVAVPYVVDSMTTTEFNKLKDNDNLLDRKKFFNIPRSRIDSALESEFGSAAGDSLASAGTSIRRLVRKMQDYVLPPQFDFLNNTDIDPVVMYMFEFKYDLDKDDLSYIWQNVAPRNYKKITFASDAVAHDLGINELMNANNLLNNDNLRWMVFKVKQRAHSVYSSMLTQQSAEGIRQGTSVSGKFQLYNGEQLAQTPSFAMQTEETTPEYPVEFNWPYDYLSLVELIKVDVEVKYDSDTPTQGSTRDPSVEPRGGFSQQAAALQDVTERGAEIRQQTGGITVQQRATTESEE